jgi:hypothetical protein
MLLWQQPELSVIVVRVTWPTSEYKETARVSCADAGFSRDLFPAGLPDQVNLRSLVIASRHLGEFLVTLDRHRSGVVLTG